MRKPVLIALIPFVMGLLMAHFVDLSLVLCLALLVTFLMISVGLVVFRAPYDASVYQGLGQLCIWMMLLWAGAFRYELVTRHFPGNHISKLPIYDRKIYMEGTISLSLIHI